MGKSGTRKTGGRRYRRTRRRGRGSDRRGVPWAGWAQQEPRGHARTVMKRDCPKGKCFLGPDKSFPVCRKYTCDISDKGLWAAYIRAKQWGGPTRSYRGKAQPRHHRRVYQKAARTAKRMLEQRGYRVGK